MCMILGFARVFWFNWQCRTQSLQRMGSLRANLVDRHLNSRATRRDMICNGSTLNALLLPFVHWPSGTLQIFASSPILVRELGDLTPRQLLSGDVVVTMNLSLLFFDTCDCSLVLHCKSLDG